VGAESLDSLQQSRGLATVGYHFRYLALRLGRRRHESRVSKQVDAGTKFEMPITDISDLAGFPGFFYAYVDGPDHALIELNSAPHHHLGHVHLLSADAVAAGEWYVKYLGATRRDKKPPSREPSFYKGYQVGPGMSLMSDNINIIIFPMQFATRAYPDAWKNRTAFDSTEGRVVDHIGFSFDNLRDAIEKMRKDGVKVTQEIETAFHGKVKYAFIEGPDRVRIELVEGLAHKE
jgi:catechol 2,3-dioxygenase-like lactoylglutathione lyase family enzyme